MASRTLSDWLTYLESLHPKTIALGLERMAQVRQRLDLQADFPIIIVGGTNGKGSVCAMLEAMLHAAGYRVGCYTSPHLLDYNERVRIGKQQASDAELCESFEKIERARKGQHPPPCRGRAGVGVEAGHDDAHDFYPHPNLPPARGKKGEAEIPLTYFEFGTLAAMQCFISHKVDVAILEVGLGGRLDAVNVFDADCSVVTSVDIDHVDYLGDTRELIGFEKAGIFRQGRVAICADSDVPLALREHAREIGAELRCIGSEFGFSLPSPAGGRGIEGEGSGDFANPTSIVKTLTPPPDETTSHSTRRSNYDRQVAGYLPPAGEGLSKGQWNFYSKVGTRSSLPFPALRGAFQLHNASAVLAALDALKDKLPVSMEAVRRGLVEVQLAGRFQFVPGLPQLILDVAHNPHAARSLAQNLAALPPSKTFAVFAMLKDKDMAGVVQALDAQVDVWLVAGIDAPRGATADELAQVLQNARVRGAVHVCSSIAEALKQAAKQAGENDRIAAFGSFYTVAEVMRLRGLRGG
ncbi:MAG: bifunctional folylpolyglutamate synthase/dihydrofolate synthase [Sideroxydans sp.]|nr:bifunctional folylpolyglutamate synthase/dihydrofolate synthase [Sideroxydans sp.]